MVNPERSVEYYACTLKHLLTEEGRTTTAYFILLEMERLHPGIYSFFQQDDQFNKDPEFKLTVLHTYYSLDGLKNNFPDTVSLPEDYPIDWGRRNFGGYFRFLEKQPLRFINYAMDAMAVIWDNEIHSSVLPQKVAV